MINVFLCLSHITADLYYMLKVNTVMYTHITDNTLHTKLTHLSPVLYIIIAL